MKGLHHAFTDSVICLGMLRWHGGQCNDDDLLLLSIHRPRIHSNTRMCGGDNKWNGYKTTLHPSKFSALILFTIYCTVCTVQGMNASSCSPPSLPLFHSFLRSQTLISFIGFACHLFVPLMQTWRFLFFYFYFFSYLIFLYIRSIAMRTEWTDDDRQCQRVHMELVDGNSE